MTNKIIKIILPAIILSALQILIFSSTSFSEVRYSKHDLSIGGPRFTFDTDEVCVFCHTPHKAIVVDIDTNRLPLWNRSISQNEVGFTPYSSTTLNAAPSQPRSMTLLCMSCHDGTSALNVVQNFRGVQTTFGLYGSNTADQIEDVYYPGAVSYPGANIGESANKDLSNDHPVSFVYDSALASSDGSLVTPFSTSFVDNLKKLPLFNGRLECATCHNPHEQGNEVDGTSPFLRMSNTNSEMCIKCHNK